MRLHHIAYVTDNVRQKADSLGKLLGFKLISGPVDDIEQGVKIIFLEMPDKTRMELLEPLDQTSPVYRHLKKGGGLYHLCFEVDDLDAVLAEIIQDNRAMIVKQPSPAPAIENQRVAFVVTREMDLIEFLESGKK